MRNAVLWIFLLISLGVVGGMEKRYRELDRTHSVEVERYEKWLEVAMSDNAKLEERLLQQRLNRSRPITDMTAREYLSLLADYLAADGRCEVVIEQVDWSSWQKEHKWR